MAECGLREFRASADARVPFPQGKGTKGCRGPARIPCGAPAPGPPADKRLVSVEPRRGAPDGVPSGSALTAPLKTFRFQRGPVLRGGKSQRVRDALCAWHSFGGAGAKKPPLKGEVPAKRAEGFRSPAPQGRGGSVSRRDHNQAYRRRATLHGRTSPKEKTSLFPATLRERGSGGEALLSEKRPLPQNLPTVNLFGREREGGGFSTEKPPPSQNHHNVTVTVVP